ncbi:MAG: COQ9 family protein [Azospirillaceae bacterium]|nr:COQ9 family protein [Azospirillaceae bacterium]
MNERTQQRDDILIATLAETTFDGWTARALRTGAVAAGFDAATARRLFPGGIPDVIDHLSDWLDRRMQDGLAHADLTALRTPDRIALAVRLRLAALSPYREGCRRLASHLALPVAAAQGLRHLARAADAIWVAVGDQATDINWYSKRATLAAVYSTTFLFWLDDRSEDDRETMAFLERRLGNAAQFGKAARRLGALTTLGGLLPSPLRMMRQVRRQRTARPPVR